MFSCIEFFHFHLHIISQLEQLTMFMGELNWYKQPVSVCTPGIPSNHDYQWEEGHVQNKGKHQHEQRSRYKYVRYESFGFKRSLQELAKYSFQELDMFSACHHSTALHVCVILCIEIQYSPLYGILLHILRKHLTFCNTYITFISTQRESAF